MTNSKGPVVNLAASHTDPREAVGEDVALVLGLDFSAYSEMRTFLHTTTAGTRRSARAPDG